MATKPYKHNNEQKETLKVSEPVAAYNIGGGVSLNEVGITTNAFTALAERAESDFAAGRYTTSDDLFSRIKQQRGW